MTAPAPSATAREALAQRLEGAGVEVVRGDGAWRALPATAGATAGVVEHALAEARAGAGPVRLVPSGGGTRLAGVRPDVDLQADDTLIVDTSRLTGIVEYEPGDGTLTALAGTPWTELAAAVEEGGHELTPDVTPRSADGASSTIGGVLGAGASGPDRLRLGPVRHHVLGAVVATGNGTLAKSGGRLVKNVTGFDVFRLHVGGRGTLGVVVEASLRLVPKPEHEAFLSLESIEARDALPLLEQLRRRAAISPRATWALAQDRPGWRLGVHLAGRARQVAEDVRATREVLGSGAELCEGAAARAASNELRDTTAWSSGADELRFVVGCVPSATDAVTREVSDWAAAGRLHGPPRFVTWPGVARIECAVPAPRTHEAADELALDLVRRLGAQNATVASAGGERAFGHALDRAAASAAGPRGRWEQALVGALDPAGLFRRTTAQARR